MTEIGHNLPPGWIRMDGPGVYGENTGNPRDIRNIRWDGNGRIPACELNFLRQGLGSCCISNVIPPGEGRFTVSDSNVAIVEFEKIARPIVERSGMEIELTSDRFDIDQWLSRSAAEKLRAFSRSANKGLGGALLVDHERWLDFVVTAHRDGSKLPATMLRQWLIRGRRLGFR